MRAYYGAELFLFGSRARGTASPESDYDLLAVAPGFYGVLSEQRALDARRLWRAAGGWGIALDLHCLSPDEFDGARREAASLVGQWHQQGELLPIEPINDQSEVERMLTLARDRGVPAGIVVT
jgi:hypothetical protein